MSQVGPSGSKWVQLGPRGAKWSQVEPSGAQWSQVEKGWVNLGHVGPSEAKWSPVHNCAMLLPFEEVFVFEGRSQNFSRENYGYTCLRKSVAESSSCVWFQNSVCVEYQWPGIVKVRWH